VLTDPPTSSDAARRARKESDRVFQISVLGSNHAPLGSAARHLLLAATGVEDCSCGAVVEGDANGLHPRLLMKHVTSAIDSDDAGAPGDGRALTPATAGSNLARLRAERAALQQRAAAATGAEAAVLAMQALKVGCRQIQ